MSRRPVVLPDSLSKARFLVRATLSNQKGGKVSGVLCGIFLPERLTDPIKLHFQPTPKQAHLVNFTRLVADAYELSFTAISNIGGRRIRFSAERVWCSSVGSGHHDGISFVTDFTGTPTDFDIIHFGFMRGSPAGGTFFLTPNVLINTAMIVSPSYTGTVKVRRICQPRFSLRNGVRLVFTKHFRYRDGGPGETISFRELVAEFRAGNPDILTVSKDLDDFLLLTSFATRHRCVCMGWIYTNPRGDMVTHYRRDIAIPKEKKISTNDTLIDISADSLTRTSSGAHSTRWSMMPTAPQKCRTSACSRPWKALCCLPTVLSTCFQRDTKASTNDGDYSKASTPLMSQIYGL